MKEIPQNVSQAVRQLNPHLYPVGAVETEVTKPVVPPPLARSPRKHKGGARSVRLVVCLTAFRRRILDDDNNTSSFKPIRDRIASRLGVDDADPRIRWETSQCPTTGEEGVVVKIQTI